ncbi:hypothetical protein N665_0596s0022 [Sinapis alba]|nr:hypothetical protein N665_0596s0022 [Sinapis alba]
MSLTMDDGVEAERGRSRRRYSLLSKQLALAVESVQWSYAIFWSSSPTQSGVLEWGEGCYNGEMKKRKKRYEARYKHVLQRSNQLRKLYLCMVEGDSTTAISTTHDDDNDNHNCNNTSMMLSPDDLSDEEWYYLLSMSYVFSPSQCLPGRALATGETIWLCNAQYADNKLFSRSLLARSASIQTVVCFPYLGGVIELGVTELISEDPSLLPYIKSCLLEASKPDFSSKNVSAHQDNDELKINKISDGNSVLQENHEIQFGISDLMLDEDLHYKRTVSTLLKHTADKKKSHRQQDLLVSSNSGSSFLRWKQPNSNLLQEHSDSQSNVLRKILLDVPLMHSVDAKRMLPNNTFGLNHQDDPSVKRKENEKFSVLRTMVPTVIEVDKEAILNNTIKYLQELEERVEELESCMGSVNFVERQKKTKKSLNDSVLMEETSGNYDDSTKIDGNSGETEQATSFRDETHLRVKVLKETEVVVEVRCSYRDYIVADIMETLSKLHMDAFSVRSHTLNGFLTLNLKAKLRGAAVASVGMIKRELRRVIGESI